MKSTPLLFKDLMVCALLNGSKTQTRRLVDVPSDGYHKFTYDGLFRDLECDYFVRFSASENGGFISEDIYCPYGKVVDQIWVKETWRTLEAFDHIKPSDLSDDVWIEYAAGGNNQNAHSIHGMSKKWRSPLFMQKRFSRITLEITGIRVERLNDISEADAIAEGCLPDEARHWGARDVYSALWESINGVCSWADNPWVWVIEFEVLK